MNTHHIQFKTKPVDLWVGDKKVKSVTIKKTIAKKDCNLRPHEHTYYNSDMFTGMLNKAYRQVVGVGRHTLQLDSLPDGVTVDDSGFLAVITVSLPESFR